MNNDYLAWFLNKLPWKRRGQINEETTIERPAFSTNIFNDRCECEEEEAQPQNQNQMFWLCVVIVLFFGGVAISYYIIH